MATMSAPRTGSLYIYTFDGRLLAEYDIYGNCLRGYIYMSSRLVAEYVPATSQYFYYTQDQIGSTRVVTDDANMLSRKPIRRGKMSAMNRIAASIPLLLLAAWSISPGQSPGQGTGTIFDAVKKGDIDSVRAFLDSGVDVNIRGEFNYTPLIAAARYDRVEIAQALIDKKAEINVLADYDEISGESGFSPLLWAASNCSLDMARLLVDRGAEVEKPGPQGDIPLMVAAKHGCLPVIEVLVKKGAAVDAVRKYDRATALIEAVVNDHLDVADYLICRGANPKIRDDMGRSMLSVAAWSGRLAAVQYFFEKGLPINGKDDSGGTAIFYALGRTIESRYILRYLVEHGGDPTIERVTGMSPLMEACREGLLWQAGYLIDNGAAVNDADLFLETPLHYACRGIPGKFEQSFRMEELESTIRLLLAKGAKVNAQDFKGKTPLIIAAREDAPRVIESLLGREAQVNTRDFRGWTALMHAADRNRTAVIKILVERGADLNQKDAKGMTALAIARQKRSSAQAYELLKSFGAN
ncbi:MAG TPA: ankyrin repeat domain-containing protein [Candidatus Aminicenantes bacterium]|nr:ankyrin repeat domain-containing protein [Candidatus Aminicenantes bacterium]HRY66172.1 ankyrin repeat domain-containing protein [Candidatus Aminicenantes bacterium]HRZ73086.1 ankyrin repeat domain-containing protein [Candidatus Aminicenantes bacterium]